MFGDQTWLWKWYRWPRNTVGCFEANSAQHSPRLQIGSAARNRPRNRGSLIAPLIPSETQACDDHVRVVSEAESVKAIRGTEFPARHERRFVIARDDGPVDRAFHAVAFHRNRDLL